MIAMVTSSGPAPRARGLAAALLLSGVTVLGGLTGCKTQETPAASQDATLATVVIPVEGMSCVSCAAAIKNRLRSINGVGDVEVSLGERHARVRFDPSRVSPDRLAAAINDLGYRAGVPVEARP
jgi:copper chaperone CopZ